MGLLKTIKVGGQAVINGIVMRSQRFTTLACRLKNGQIDVERFSNKNSNRVFLKMPLIRGVVNFIQMFADGLKYITLSATKTEFYTEEEQNSLKKEGKFAAALGACLGVILTIIFFVWLPQTLSVFCLVGQKKWFKLLLETLLKLVVLIAYMFFISKTKDIKEVFMYHGAEHKTINCYESGKELTVTEVKTASRFHLRCGTNFIFITLLISMLMAIPLNWSNSVRRLILKMCLIPLVVGISYEIIRLAGKNNNLIFRFLMAPGMWLQRITTCEPNDSQIEVAIAALQDVLNAERGRR
ncbi:MAG: DUF1385 domain-containing protein [Oscillospiraceae bacterium]|nr:DUF1385 domain-containing protein [Oscillospiraceae bacterium]